MRISDWSSDVCSSDLGLPHPEAPENEQRRIVRCHGMFDVRLVVERPADARLEPVGGAVLTAPGRQDEIDLFRSVPLVGIAHMRAMQGGSDRSIVSAFLPSDRTAGR